MYFAGKLIAEHADGILRLRDRTFRLQYAGLILETHQVKRGTQTTCGRFYLLLYWMPMDQSIGVDPPLMTSGSFVRSSGGAVELESMEIVELGWSATAECAQNGSQVTLLLQSIHSPEQVSLEFVASPMDPIPQDWFSFFYNATQSEKASRYPILFAIRRAIRFPARREWTNSDRRLRHAWCTPV
jgi:hypothetical protein